MAAMKSLPKYAESPDEYRRKPTKLPRQRVVGIAVNPKQ